MPSEVLGSAPGLAVDHESERVFTPAVERQPHLLRFLSGNP